MENFDCPVLDDASNESIIVEKSALDPDHPLLEKFQAALKEQLLLQISILKGDIFEYETEAKKKSAEKEALGIQIYEAQQQVCDQQKVLNKIISQLEGISAASEHLEDTLRERKLVLKELKERKHERDKAVRETQGDIEAVNLLIHQMTKCEGQIESDILVSKCIAEKTRIDNVRIAKEKRTQDAVLYKLMVEVCKLEREIDDLCMQLKIKTGDLENMEQKIAQGNTNAEALQAEYRCLMHSWNSVVNAIATRDRTLICVNAERYKRQEQMKSIITEIQQVRKLIKKEQEDNERNSLVKSGIESDVKNCEIQMDQETKKKDILEKTIYQLTDIIQQTDKDAETVSIQCYQMQRVLFNLSKEFDKISAEKSELEGRIVANLGNQAVNDKAVAVLHKNLNEVIQLRKGAGIVMYTAENKSSLLGEGIRSQKITNQRNRDLLKELAEQEGDLGKEADILQREQEKIRLKFSKAEMQVEVLMNKYGKTFLTGIIDTPDLELRVKCLEKDIVETQRAIEKLRYFWLNEQKNLLRVSKHRQEQIHQIHNLRNRVIFLEDQHIKIGKELETQRKAEDRINRNMENLISKSSALTRTLMDVRNKKQNLTSTNIFAEDEYEAKLKDSELACLRLEADIAEIEDDKVGLSKVLMEANREALEWEKKMLLTKDTLNTVKAERSQGGETENLKHRIHKLRAAYAQLKKTEEGLVKQLNLCVARRDAIFTSCVAREKQSKEAGAKTRITYLRTINSRRNKIKQKKEEVAAMQEKIHSMEGEKIFYKGELSRAKCAIEGLKLYKEELFDDIEVFKTRRQLTFELLINHQKQLRLFTDLSTGKIPIRLYKTKAQLDLNTKQQTDLNGRISRVLQNLISRFPKHPHTLRRMMNTLKLYIYTRNMEGEPTETLLTIMMK